MHSAGPEAALRDAVEGLLLGLLCRRLLPRPFYVIQLLDNLIGAGQLGAIRQLTHELDALRQGVGVIFYFGEAPASIHQIA